MRFAGLLPLLLSVLAAAEAAGQAPVDTTIVIRTEGSALEFLPARISVRQGLRVRLRYVNAGTLPHNIVVVRDDDDIDALADGAMRVGGDYVPLDQTEKMHRLECAGVPRSDGGAHVRRAAAECDHWITIDRSDLKLTFAESNPEITQGRPSPPNRTNPAEPV
jgi:plastocyanin